MRGQMRLHLVVGRRTAALRRWLAPRPWVRRVVLVASAAVFVTAVADHRHDLTAARAAWGDTKPVWVARTDSVAGEPISAELVELPLAVLPGRPTDADPNGVVARQSLTTGEVVVAVDVAPDGAPADLIPGGWLAVPIAEATEAHARVGERVVVTTDGVIVSDRALVVDTNDGVPLVAVPAEVAPLVALANDTGVTLLRTP